MSRWHLRRFGKSDLSALGASTVLPVCFLVAALLFLTDFLGSIT